MLIFDYNITVLEELHEWIWRRTVVMHRTYCQSAKHALRPGRVLRALSTVAIFHFVNNINKIRLIARHTFPRIIRCFLACYPCSFAVSYLIFFLQLFPQALIFGHIANTDPTFSLGRPSFSSTC